jgi:hypothetical protein
MIGNLKKERDAALTSSSASTSAPSSLLDELEANMDKKIQQQEQRPVSVSQFLLSCVSDFLFVFCFRLVLLALMLEMVLRRTAKSTS